MLDKPFRQYDLMVSYKLDGKIAGLCAGLSIEYARHHFSCKLKGKNSDFIKKLNKKTSVHSEHFIDRVTSYQKYYDRDFLINYRAPVYNLDKDLTGFIEHITHKTSSEVLLLTLYPMKKGCRAHGISVTIDRSDNKECSYKIFDPNLGESLTISTKEELYDRLSDIQALYKDHYECDISILYVDALKLLPDRGILESNIASSKYSYKIFDSIERGDLSSTFELNKNAKIVYDSIDDNPLDLAIYKLSEDDVIKMILENNKISIKRDIEEILWSFIDENKLTVNVLEALITKLEMQDSANNQYAKSLLHELKYLILDSKENIKITLADKKTLKSITLKSNNIVIKTFLENEYKDMRDLLKCLNELNMQDNLQAKIIYQYEEKPIYLDSHFISDYNLVTTLEIIDTDIASI